MFLASRLINIRCPRNEAYFWGVFFCCNSANITCNWKDFHPPPKLLLHIAWEHFKAGKGCLQFLLPLIVWGCFCFLYIGTRWPYRTIRHQHMHYLCKCNGQLTRDDLSALICNQDHSPCSFQTSSLPIGRTRAGSN